jgi:hypothetical protein
MDVLTAMNEILLSDGCGRGLRVRPGAGQTWRRNHGMTVPRLRRCVKPWLTSCAERLSSPAAEICGHLLRIEFVFRFRPDAVTNFAGGWM